MLPYCEPKMEMQKKTVEWRIEKGRRVKYIQRAKRNVYLWLTFSSCISWYKITSLSGLYWTLPAAAWFDVIVVRSLDVCPIHYSVHKNTHTLSSSCAFNFICSLAPFMSKQNILIKCANGMCGHGQNERRGGREGREWIFCSIHDNPISLCVHTSEERRSSDSKNSLLPFWLLCFQISLPVAMPPHPLSLADFRSTLCMCGLNGFALFCVASIEYTNIVFDSKSIA